MKNKLKNFMVFFIISLMIISCKKNDEKLSDDYPELTAFSGSIGEKNETWHKPDYNSQQTKMYWSGIVDSISYSYQIFNEYNRISLYTKSINANNPLDLFKIGNYKIGIDYNIVLLQGRNFYTTNFLTNDSIELFKIVRIGHNKILCYYRFDCNLYCKNGNYYDHIKNGNLSAIFDEINK
jgi:hypothetical protein